MEIHIPENARARIEQSLLPHCSKALRSATSWVGCCELMAQSLTPSLAAKAAKFSRALGALREIFSSRHIPRCQRSFPSGPVPNAAMSFLSPLMSTKLRMKSSAWTQVATYRCLKPFRPQLAQPIILNGSEEAHNAYVECGSLPHHKLKLPTALACVKYVPG